MELLDTGTDSTANMIVGTIGYMSPEQLRAQKAEPASDLFSLGCVMYEMLTGEGAFARVNQIETSMAVLCETAPSISRRSFPSELASIVATCLVKEPAARYGSARDLAVALRSLLSGVSGARKARRMWSRAMTFAVMSHSAMRSC